MDDKPHACLWPLKPAHEVTATEQRAMAEIEGPAFDPEKAFEWPDEQLEHAQGRDPALK